MTTKRRVMRRPVVTRARWEASFLMSLLKRSMVKIVEAELSMDASELITAPAIAANMNPRIPSGIKFRIKRG